MKNNMSRRTLLAQAGAVAAGAAWSRKLVGQSTQPADKPVGANGRVGVAVIGCGQRGCQLLDLLLRRNDVDIPVVCDVDSQRTDLAAKRAEEAGRRKPDTSGDYIAVLKRNDVDAVILATPDHWHCTQHMYACLARKDIYIEAPISQYLIEGAAMVHASRRFRRVVQVGMQHRSAKWFGEAAEAVRGGKVGKIAQTRSWDFAKIKPIAHQGDGQPPEALDYDRWVGPSPMRPYNAGRSHGFAQNWWDYGGGMVTRWNVHHQDLIHWAMKTNTPVSVASVGGNQGLGDFRETPDTLEVLYEYDTQLQPRPGRFLHAYSLRLSNGHAAWAAPIPAHFDHIDPATTRHSGVSFFGEDATLLVDRSGVSTFPTTFRQDKPIEAPPRERERRPFDTLTADHLDDFINCVRTRGEPKAPIEAGQYATAACHLANISYRVGRKLYYNHSAVACFTDPLFQNRDTQATEMLSRETYRDPYRPPKL